MEKFQLREMLHVTYIGTQPRTRLVPTGHPKNQKIGATIISSFEFGWLESVNPWEGITTFVACQIY
jgi:hypothetical protein